MKLFHVSCIATERNLWDIQTALVKLKAANVVTKPVEAPQKNTTANGVSRGNPPIDRTSHIVLALLAKGPAEFREISAEMRKYGFGPNSQRIRKLIAAGKIRKRGRLYELKG